MPDPSAPVAAPTARRPRNPILRALRFVTWLAVALLGLALLAAFLLPLDLTDRSPLALDLAWAAMMVRTFAYHAVAALLLCLLLAALLRAPRLAALAASLALATLILGGATATRGPSLRIAQAARMSDGPPTLKVITLNLWAGLRDLSRVEALIAAERPDIILFQEYTPHHHRALATTQSLAANYPFIDAQPATDFSGMAIYSRLPMRPEDGRLVGARGVALLDASEWERQPSAVIQWQGHDILVQNIHLPTAPMSRSLLRLHHALLLQMRDWLAHETRPILMAGDFNCTPTSAQAAVIRAAGLTDTHRAVGSGLGTTWGHRLAWPGFRIDHVYTRDLTPIAIQVGPDVGSDHRPVIALLELVAPPPAPTNAP